MRKSIASVADRLLTAVLPRDEAAAACPPDCQQHYTCSNHYEYTYTCCYAANCNLSCGPAQYVGPC